jgi:hypothetical protein
VTCRPISVGDPDLNLPSLAVPQGDEVLSVDTSVSPSDPFERHTTGDILGEMQQLIDRVSVAPSGTVRELRAHVLYVPGVHACEILVTGIASFEAVVGGGDEFAVHRAINEARPSGVTYTLRHAP